MVKKYKKTDMVSYTLGTTLTIELLKKKIELVQRIYFHSKIDKNETYYQIESICKYNGIPMEFSDKVFNILSNKDNCFVIGEFKKFESSLDNKEPHVVLVNPSNSGNLGTIIRTAVGFGINNIAIVRPAVDIYDPKTVRSSMGALFHLNFTYYESFQEYLQEYSNHKIYPFMLKGSLSLSEVEFNGQYSLIFGNEASGLPDEFLNYGQSLIIKHSGNIDSLNLPIAVSIALYEATKKKFK